MDTSRTGTANAILTAVAAASDAFARTDDPTEALPGALAAFGIATGAAGIAAFDRGPEGEGPFREIATWHADNGGEATHGTAEALVVPVLVDDATWGELSLTPGATTGKEEGTAAALRILAGSLGSALGRQRARAALAAAEEEFRTIVERTGRMIYYVQEIDPDDPTRSRTISSTSVRSDLLGYSTEEIEADPLLWRENVHPDDRERVFAADAESNLEHDEHFSLEYRMVAKDGSVVWFLDEATLIEAPGAPARWHGILLDITDHKETELLLEESLAAERAAASRLRLMDETKNTFLQAVSHDLRTPLAAIFGLAVTLERDEVHLAPEDARDLAHRIAVNARRLDRLVSNLLDMDRLARGIVEPNREETDAAALIRRVVEESGPPESRTLILDLDDVTAAIDAAKVERIVENLLVNAIRHTPPEATIWMRLRGGDGEIRIDVEDDGEGIPEDQREQIFEPFQQRSDRPEPSPGIGVGLTLARRFAELHGGSAWVQDRDGGPGASFRVTLADVPDGSGAASDPPG